MSSCRTSVRLDRRHYNAWYGIGLTYYKQERFQLAEIYYRCSVMFLGTIVIVIYCRRALAISPNSPVLMCHVAVVQVNSSTPISLALLYAPKKKCTIICSFSMLQTTPKLPSRRSPVLSKFRQSMCFQKYITDDKIFLFRNDRQGTCSL